MLIAGCILGQFSSTPLRKNTLRQTRALQKLSSGLRINSASDDAAGLSISEGMRSQIFGLRMAARNVQDGISLIQTADGALNEDHAILQRMRELTVQAANDTNTTSDRQAISGEVSRLIEELDNILTNTQFNTKKLFMGLDTDPITLQVGANSGDVVQLFIQKSILPSYGYFAAAAPPLIIGVPGNNQIVDLSTSNNASQFLSVIDTAVSDLSNQRANLGAMQNRLEHTLDNIQSSDINMSASESRIRDTDMAQEITEYTKDQILSNAAMAVQAQAGQLSNNMLIHILGLN